MTPQEELAALRRLAELERKVQAEESSFVEKFATNLKTGSQKLVAGLVNLPLLPGRLMDAGAKKAFTAFTGKDASAVPSTPLMAPNYFDQLATDAGKESKEKGFQNPYGRAAVEAIPAMTLYPASLLSQAPKAVAAANFLPPVAAEGVRSVLGDTAGDIAAPVLGLATGMALGPSLRASEKRVSRAVRSMTPDDFAQTRANLATTQAGGAQTATLADLVPHNRLVELGNEVRMNLPDSTFSQRVNQRPEDLLELGRRAISGAGIVARPEITTERVALLANQTIANTKAGFSQQLDQSLRELPDIPQTRMKPLYDALQNVSRDRSMPLPFDAEAVRGAADALRSPNTPGLIVSSQPRMVQVTLPSGARTWRIETPPPTEFPGLLERPVDMSLALSKWRNAQNPALAAPGAKVIDQASAAIGSRLANFAIDAEVPGYLSAKNAYRDAMTGVINPMERGPLGQLAGPQLGNPNRVTKGQLDSVISELSPDGARDLIGSLRATDQAAGPSNIGQQIASLLVQKRLNSGGTNPGQSVIGRAGFPKDENLAAVLDASGINPQSIRAPLEAADLLQNFKGTAPGTGQQPVSKLGALIRPFRHGDLAVTQNLRDQYYREISDLLADPQANMARLQELAMLDPNLRRQLSMISAINANSLQQGN